MPRPFPIAVTCPAQTSPSSMPGTASGAPHDSERRRVLGRNGLQRSPSLCSWPAGYNPHCRRLIVLYLHARAPPRAPRTARQGRCAPDIDVGPEYRPRPAACLRRPARFQRRQLLGRPGHFAAYVDEAAERLMRPLRRSSRRCPPVHAAPVVSSPTRGGYLSTAYAL